MTFDPVEDASSEQLGGLVLSVSMVTGPISQSQSVSVIGFMSHKHHPTDVSEFYVSASGETAGGSLKVRIRKKKKKSRKKRSAMWSMCVSTDFFCGFLFCLSFRTATDHRGPSWEPGCAAPQGGRVGGPSCR